MSGVRCHVSCVTFFFFFFFGQSGGTSRWRVYPGLPRLVLDLTQLTLSGHLMDHGGPTVSFSGRTRCVADNVWGQTWFGLHVYVAWGGTENQALGLVRHGLGGNWVCVGSTRVLRVRQGFGQTECGV